MNPPDRPAASGSRPHAFAVREDENGAAEQSVAELGATALSGWTLGFTFANGQTINNMWGGTTACAPLTVRRSSSGQ